MMNLNFTNEQLYPSAYGLTPEFEAARLTWARAATGLNDPLLQLPVPVPFRRVVTLDDHPDRSRCTQIIYLDDVEDETPKPTITRIDIVLDRWLTEQGIDYDNPLHMIHDIEERDDVFALVWDYCKELGEDLALHGRQLDELTEIQLRKLALILYDDLGGTKCG